jgi:iron-sulfur cluster assembly protein
MMNELIRERESPDNNAPAAEQKPRRWIKTVINWNFERNMAINLTPTAANRVREFLEKDGGVGLRLGVRKTGCSGWAYTVELADAVEANDVVFEQAGVKLVVADESLAFLDGSTIDFVAEGLGSTFRFQNPNATDECGCGESFTIS